MRRVQWLCTVVLVLPLILLLAPIGIKAQANTNSMYQQLRGLLPAGEEITVSNLEFHRDAAIFTFRSGGFVFYSAVNGKITGAVFKGDGHFHLVPPTEEEKRNLKLLNKSETFDEDFNQAVFRFTDSTAAELQKSATGKTSGSGGFSSAASDLHEFHRDRLLENIDLRILEDVLSPTAGGYFFAAIHGSNNAHLIFRIDPHGASDVAPEEVSLESWSSWGPTYLSAFHLSSELANGTANGNEDNGTYRIDHEDLDTTIEKNGFLTGQATVHLIAQTDGLAVAPLALYPTLRVSSAQSGGSTLSYVQEAKDKDADFGVILPHPLKKGEAISLTINYSGKDVVKDEGGANYYPVARDSWYPSASSGLGNFATYKMTFHVPKGLQLIATGTRTSEVTDGKITTSQWTTDVPLAVVGFNLGRFKMKEATIKGKMGDDLAIDAYANSTPPDELSNLGEANLGNFNAVGMLPVELDEGQVAARMYTAYFGSLPFSRVALTQQFACNYGQSWPMLVYLPICGFLDQTQQFGLGIDPANMYWKIVTAHEVAHQWWGQTVGFRSYRDQWMSEGFANTSAAIFLQLTHPKMEEYRNFWKQQRQLLTEKNRFGFRPIDVGPVTMGFRLSSQKTGWNIYQDLVYPKGAYILHMIRMMMWNPKDGDATFIATMHDFVNTYRLKAATTEDFKSVVEKHMTPGMDLDGNHRMDWFFNEYVYGTDLPTYHTESELTPNGNGTKLHLKITESGVPDSFKMIVPIYLELENGHAMRLGEARVFGSTPVELNVQLPKMASQPKKVALNYYYDVLSLGN